MLERVESALFIVLLVLSSVMYIWAFICLAFQRTLPDEVAPPRITLVALGLCAAKAILGPSNAWLQTPLTILVLLPCLYAIFCILQNVIHARRLPLFHRQTVDRWAVVMIPPIFSVGLLSLQLTISDSQTSMLIDAFILVNLIPAVYLLTQMPLLMAGLRSKLSRNSA